MTAYAAGGSPSSSNSVQTAAANYEATTGQQISAYKQLQSAQASGSQAALAAAQANVTQTNIINYNAYQNYVNVGGNVGGAHGEVAPLAKTVPGYSPVSNNFATGSNATASIQSSVSYTPPAAATFDVNNPQSVADATNTNSEGRINFGSTTTSSATSSNPIPTTSSNSSSSQPVTSTTTLPTPASSTINNSTVVTVSNPANYDTLVAVNDQRIRLTPKDSSILTPGSMLAPLIPTQGLMFPYTPAFVYQGTSNYGTQNLVHANQQNMYFTNVASTTFTITGKFTAQTDQEAQYLLGCLHFLRVTQKMRFGQGSSLGLPPPVLVLNGYGLAMLNNLSVIVTNFSMSMDDVDIDYVQTYSQGLSAWVPAVTTISVTCVVQNTPNKLRTFNWDTFASGALLTSGGWS
jgi:hypothetical protein